MENKNLNKNLAEETGNAAKRMSQQTIHRLVLGLDKENTDAMKKDDVIIIDETSMIKALSPVIENAVQSAVDLLLKKLSVLAGNDGSNKNNTDRSIDALRQMAASGVMKTSDFKEDETSIPIEDGDEGIEAEPDNDIENPCSGCDDCGCNSGAATEVNMYSSMLAPINQISKSVKNGIGFTLVPTLYGSGVLINLPEPVNGSSPMDMLKITRFVHDMRAEDLIVLPVTIEKILDMYNSCITETIHYNYSEDGHMWDGVKYMFIIEAQEMVNSGGYSFPAASCGYSVGIGAVASSMEDLYYAIMSYRNIYKFDLVLPDKGYKVLRKGGCKNGTEYEQGILYYVSGELVPHKNGIHYAKTASVCKDWYRNDWRENDVVIVQAGHNVKKNGDIAVTDSLIVLEDISWESITY